MIFLIRKSKACLALTGGALILRNLQAPLYIVSNVIYV